MKLETVQKESLKTGDVLVYRGLISSSRTRETKNFSATHFYKLVIVVSMGEGNLVLSPFSAVWDVPDEQEISSASVSMTSTFHIPKHINCHNIETCLARPVFEVGDLLKHRNRPARITETKAKDLHVSIFYEDSTGGGFYGNLIWMDLGPTLNLLGLHSPWPQFAGS